MFCTSLPSNPCSLSSCLLCRGPARLSLDSHGRRPRRDRRLGFHGTRGLLGLLPAGFSLGPRTPQAPLASHLDLAADGAFGLFYLMASLVARTRHSKNILVASALEVRPSGRSSWKTTALLLPLIGVGCCLVPEEVSKNVHRVFRSDRDRPAVSRVHQGGRCFVKCRHWAAAIMTERWTPEIVVSIMIEAGYFQNGPRQQLASGCPSGHRSRQGSRPLCPGGGDLDVPWTLSMSAIPLSRFLFRSFGR